MVCELKKIPVLTLNLSLACQWFYQTFSLTSLRVTFELFTDSTSPIRKSSMCPRLWMQALSPCSLDCGLKMWALLPVCVPVGHHPTYTRRCPQGAFGEGHFFFLETELWILSGPWTEREGTWRQEEERLWKGRREDIADGFGWLHSFAQSWLWFRIWIRQLLMGTHFGRSLSPVFSVK